MLEAALAGTRVLDFSQGIAGPHAALLLAEMGAGVVKVEPPAGDWLRGIGVRREDSSVLFAYLNRGKAGVSLDLKQPQAREAALALIGQADVLIESYRPGVMARLGLDSAALGERFPRLVYLSITGFGQDGPEAHRPATDAVMQAYTGLSYGAGDMKEPVRVRIALVDIVTGIYASHAVLGALLERARTGLGQHLDVSLMHGAAALQGTKYAEHAAAGGNLQGELLAGIGLYRTADGYLAMSAMREEQTIALLKVIGRSDLLSDTRFATADGRFANQAALREVVAQALAGRPTAFWVASMRPLDLLCQAVLDYDAFRREPQVQHRQLFQPFDLGAVGAMRQLPAVRMPGLRAEAFLDAAPPRLGAQTCLTLEQAGVAKAAIEDLIASGGAIQAV